MVATLEQDIFGLDGLTTLVSYLISRGYKVIAPKREDNLVLFSEVVSGSEVLLNHVNTRNSIKEFFFPCTEKILSFRFAGKGVEVEDPSDAIQKTVILGAKPCDTASLPILDKLFQADYRDPFWFKKRDSTIVISVACTRSDAYCFCTSVGVSPDSKRGCDVMLSGRRVGGFSVEGVTIKGKKLLGELTEILCKENNSVNSDQVQEAVSDANPSTYACSNINNLQDSHYHHAEDADKACMPGSRFDFKMVKQWLDNNFEDPFWAGFSRQCLGCGVCTFLCPTCHCFDIVDEGNLEGGNRLKNWDACQMKMFTIHTSGHNPRSTQAQRWRQRIMHKFRYYVDKFDDILCVGCGRCSRHCPVDMNLAECLSRIANKI